MATDGHAHGHGIWAISHNGLRMRCSYKHATIVLCCLNVVTVIFLLQALLGPFYKKPSHITHELPEHTKIVREGEEVRRAMEPVELIKRIKELQLESESASEGQVQRKVSRQNNAAEISKRLNNLRATDPSSQKALEEWRKRKMERAKIREMEKNGTSTTTSDKLH